MRYTFGDYVLDTQRQELQRTRQQYHQRIAQALAAHFPETIETQPELLAHHYTEAGLGEHAIPWWQRQGRRHVAHQLLAPIYGWFTESFDTADLQEGKALLEELRT